jgi:hypothetical protein
LDVDIGTYVEQQNSVVSESIGLRRCGTWKQTLVEREPTPSPPR